MGFSAVYLNAQPFFATKSCRKLQRAIDFRSLPFLLRDLLGPEQTFANIFIRAEIVWMENGSRRDLLGQLNAHPQSPCLARRYINSLPYIYGVSGSGERLETDEILARERPELKMAHDR